jgi:hypothetical protein
MEMDALPVKEPKGLPFASKAKGKYLGRAVDMMHACGPDAHTAILMATAEVLTEQRLSSPQGLTCAGGRQRGLRSWSPARRARDARIKVIGRQWGSPWSPPRWLCGAVDHLSRGSAEPHESMLRPRLRQTAPRPREIRDRCAGAAAPSAKSSHIRRTGAACVRRHRRARSAPDPMSSAANDW